MQIYYIGSAGRIDLDKSPYRLLADTDLFDYAYDYDITVRKKAKNLTPKIVPKTMNVVITGKTKEDAEYNKQRFLEIIDADSFRSQEGALYVGDYYMPGIFTESKKPTKYLNSTVIKVSLTFYPNRNGWIREELGRYYEGSYDYDQPYLDFNYDYDYDFYLLDKTSELDNDSYVPTNFLLTIYGACTNPVISIGQNNYGIIGDIGENEYVEIDTEKCTITKYTADDEAINIFNQRIKDFYVFQPIESGINVVAWNGLFSFVIKLFKERREPIWMSSLPPIDPPIDPPIIIPEIPQA